jgi:hypothetical protein
MRVCEPPCHADGSDIVLIPNLNAAVHGIIKGKTMARADTQGSRLEIARFSNKSRPSRPERSPAVHQH